MVPEVQVRKLLASDPDLKSEMDMVRGKVLEQPQVYLGTPDFNNTTDASIIALSPWIRVTLIPGEDVVHADDKRWLVYPSVQVDFWVRKQDIAGYEQLQKKIYDLMFNAGWERYYYNAYVDSDTPALRMVTANFQNFQGLPNW
ncbi:MAG: phage tail protein [Lactobacillus sp.]|jgi:hypothetical protein|nr:phage tail protein [Lactobacillus sp.]